MKTSNVKTLAKSLTAFLFCTGWLCQVSAHAVPPLVLKPGAPTSAEYQKQVLSLAMAEIDLYPRHTQDPPQVQELAMKFLVRAAHFKSEMPASLCPEGSRAGDVIALAKQVIQVGSTDPLVLRYSATILMEEILDGVLTKRAELARKQFEQSSYPKHFQAKYDSTIHQVIVHRYFRPQLVPTMKAVHRSLPAYLRWAMKKTGCERAVYHNMLDEIKLNTDFHQAKHFNSFRHWLDRYLEMEDKDPWVTLMLEGTWHNELAWKARGNGYASTVKEEDWITFDKELEKAATKFRQAHALHPDRPEAASKMVGVIRSGYNDKESIWDWFQKCIDAEVDHFSAYRAIFSFLHPKWGGKVGDREEFAQLCADSKRFDTNIPMHYYLWAKDADRRQSLKERLTQNPEIYTTSQQCLLGMANSPLRKAPDGLGGNQVRYLCWALLNAIRADEVKDAIDLWQQLGEDVHSFEANAMFTSNRITPLYEKSRTFAYHEFYDELLAIQPLTDVSRAASPEITQIVHDTYSELLERASPESERYLRTWKKITQQELKFSDGDWVELEFDNQIDTWNTKGDWEVVNSRTVKANNYLGDNETYTHSKSLFPDPIEMELEISGPQKNMVVGIVRLSDGQSPYQWSLFGSQLRGGYVFKGSYSKSGSWVSNEVPKTLNVMSWGPDYNEFRINGKVIAEYTCRSLKEDSVMVGISQRFGLTGKFHSEFSNLRVRRIPYGPPPANEKYTERVDYFTQALARYPDRFDYNRHRGTALYELERWDEALADFKIARGRSSDSVNKFVEYFTGNTFAKLGKRKLAESTWMDLYLSLPKKDPTDADTLFCNGAACEVVELLTSSKSASKEELSRASKLAQQLVANHDHCRSYIALARSQLAMKQWDDVEQSLTLALSKKPTEDEVDLISEIRRAIKRP